MVMRSGEDIAGDKDAKPAKPLPWKHIAIAAIAAASILGLIAAISLFNTNPAATTTSSGWQPPPEPANPGGWIPPDEPNDPAVAITNPPEKVVKQFLKEYPHIKLYPTKLTNFDYDDKKFWLSDPYPINDLPSEMRYTTHKVSIRDPSHFFVVIKHFEPGGRISGYVEYRGTTESALFIPPTFKYISKYSTNPSGTSHMFIFPCKPMGFTVNDIKTTYPVNSSEFKQNIKWVDSSIYDNNPYGIHFFSPGEKLYFESIPEDQQDQQVEKLFYPLKLADGYRTALREQAQWVYLSYLTI